MMRWLRHLFAPSARGLFPTDALERITAAITASEARHTAEICFAVESALPLQAVWAGADARQRAIDAFSELRVWDTRANNGVLLYLLLADHRIEIVADRGLDGRVSPQQWRGACQRLEERLRAGEPEAAVLAGIEAMSALLVEHFPRVAGEEDSDELSNSPNILR
jgi:uncharacterized membrane protein